MTTGRLPDPQRSGAYSLLALLLKTLAAEDRASLCRFEGNGRVLATLRTSGSGLGFGGRLSWNRRPQNGNSFCLTGLTTLWFVLELLVVKKQLFARGENKVGTAVDTLENLVLEFHPSPHSPVTLSRMGKRIAFPTRKLRAESLRTPPRTITLGFGPPAEHAGLQTEKN